MLDITKEYFDTTIKELAKELKDFVLQENDKMKEFVRQQDDNLARIVAKGFEDLEERLDVTHRVEKLEREFTELKQALRV